jgi:phosphoribosylamine-glycine ligase
VDLTVVGPEAPQAGLTDAFREVDLFGLAKAAQLEASKVSTKRLLKYDIPSANSRSLKILSA